MNGKLVARVAVDTTVLTIDKAYDYLVPDTASQIQPGHRVLVPFGRANALTEAIVLSLPETSPYEKLKYIDTVLDKEPVLDEAGINLALYVRDRSFATLYSVVKAMVPAGFWYKGIKLYTKSPGFDGASLRVQFADCTELLALIAVLEKSDAPLTADALGDAMQCRITPSVINFCKDNGIIAEVTTVRPAAQDKNQKLYSLSSECMEAFGSNTLTGVSRNRIAEFLFSVGQASQKEITYYTGASAATVTAMAKKGLLETSMLEVLRSPKPEEVRRAEPISLSSAQREAYEGLCAMTDAGNACCGLLHGITGSGKTLVYIELLKHVIASGRTGIVLVPEISLTPQLLQRFYSQFGGRVAMLHSALSVGERYDEWRRIRRGDVDVVIGTRSAIFAPLKNIGVIILDEEHEHTYRSDSMPRYNALDVAKYRCRQESAVLLLGSATPSVESMYYAQTGKYSYFYLPERFGGATLPTVYVSDSKAAYRDHNPGVIGPELRLLLSDAFASGEQAILLVNRRGTGRHLVCMDCGHIPMCPNCSVALKYHMANDRIICHQCGYSQRRSNECPECGSHHLESVGIGTQLVEATVKNTFPDIDVIRMDSDTTSGKNSHASLLKEFAEKKAQVLVGTQMVAKGLDFENVTVSAVIDADASLYAGDWRASEQAFAMMTQLTGRSGRGKKPGNAVIQTATPSHFVIQSAAAQDYMGFYHDEIELRRVQSQPPFVKLISLTISAKLDQDAYHAARQVRYVLDDMIAARKLSFDVLGPAPAAIQKLNNVYRYCIVLRGPESRAMRDTVWELLLTYDRKRFGKTTIFADANG